MADKNWDLAVQLRGRSFARNLETYKMLTRLKPPKEAFNESGKPAVSFSVNNVVSLASIRATSLSLLFYNDYNGVIKAVTRQLRNLMTRTFVNAVSPCHTCEEV